MVLVVEDYVYTEQMFPDSCWSRIRFAVYTQNMNPKSKLSGFVMSPELKVETLYPDTYKSEFPFSVNAVRTQIP